MRKIISSLLFVGLIASYLGYQLYELNIHKNDFADQIQKIIGNNLQIKQLPKFQLFPVPSFTFNNIEIEQNNEESVFAFVSIPSISVNFSALKLLQGKIEPVAIELSKPKINVNNIVNGFNQATKIGSSLTNNSINIFLKDAVINLSNSNIITRSIKEVNLQVISNNNILNVMGNFNLDDLHNKFKLNVGKNGLIEDGSFLLESDLYNLKLNNQEIVNNKFSTYFDFDILDSKFLSIMLTNISPKFSNISKHKLSNNINLKGKITIDQAKLFTMSNITISANGTEGYGYAEISDHLDYQSKIKFDFVKINIDQLLHLDQDTNQNNQTIFANIFGITNSLLDTKKLNSNYELDFSANKILINKKIIHTLKSKFIVNDGAINVQNLQAILPDNFNVMFKDISFRVDAKKRSTIEGNLLLKGNNIVENIKWLGLEKSFLIDKNYNNFSLQTQFSISPNQITLLEFDNQIGSTSIVGNCIVNNNNNKIVIKSNLLFKNYDATKTKFVKLADIWASLSQNTNQSNYLSHYSVLRDIQHDFNIHLDFDNLNFSNKNITKASMDVILRPGIVVLSNINVKDKKYDIAESFLQVDARSINPKISLNLNANKIDLSNNHNETKPFILIDDYSKFINEKINLFRFDKFEGNLDIDISHLEFNHFILKNVGLDARMNNGKLIVDFCEADIFDGTINIKGAKDYDNDIGHSFSFAYSINNFTIPKMLTKIIGNNNIIEGIGSLSGNLLTHGHSYKEFYQNLVFNMPIIVKSLVIGGLDLAKLQQIAYKKIGSDHSIREVIDSAFSKGSTKFSGFNATVKAKNAVLKVSNGNIDDDNYTGSLVASFDLKNLLLNSMFRIVFLQNKKPINIDYNIFGNIADLTVKINKNNYLKYIEKLYVKTDAKVANVAKSKQ